MSYVINKHTTLLLYLKALQEMGDLVLLPLAYHSYTKAYSAVAAFEGMKM